MFSVLFSLKHFSYKVFPERFLPYFFLNIFPIKFFPSMFLCCSLCNIFPARFFLYSFSLQRISVLFFYTVFPVKVPCL